MERNGDWKGPVAIILAGLALFVALAGRDAFPSMGGAQGQTIVVAGDANNPPRIVLGDGGSTGAAPAPAPVPSAKQPGALVPPAKFYGDGGPFWVRSSVGHGISGFLGGFLRFAVLALLLFLAFRFFGRRRWQGHGAGGYGYGPWNGPWQGQGKDQGPAQGPATGQGQAQSYQPGQGPGHWEWHAEGPAPRTEPNYGENHGDIARPGEGNQE